MPDKKVSLTTKTVATLLQLQKSGRLMFHANSQRGRAWTKTQKAGFVYSILNNRLIHPIYVLRTSGMKKGRTQIEIIDGQSELAALGEFLDDDFGLTERRGGDVAEGCKGKRYSDLPQEFQRKLRRFKFTVLELAGYSNSDRRDVLALMHNRMVRLSKQELHHARLHANLSSVEK